jgi:exosome complex component RRP4
MSRKVVIPGEMLGEGRAGHGAFEERRIDESGSTKTVVFSKVLGLAEEREGMDSKLYFVIPLSGVYNPKRGDGVIGKVDQIIFSKFIVDINSPYEAVLPLNEVVDEFVDLTTTDLTKYLDFNDLVFAEIVSVTKTKNIQLSMKNRKCRKLRGGRLIKVTPAKVPRIIGKSGSMVEMIKEITGTQIVVGQNGFVWVKGDNEDIATEAVLFIEQMSHISGLTDRVKDMLERKMSERR